MRRGFFLPCALIAALSQRSYAQNPDTLGTPSALKRLSLVQLMDVDVTSVSRRSETLIGAASAIFVISGEDIRRSGATTLAEALRLAPNLQVAQANASQFAISARGFNNVLANKLLVMIDGRTVYTPLYAGVFWDVQQPPLSSIDRIEVISGPGGALWGANAVNGVINVITRSAAQTPGIALSAAAGTELREGGYARWGTRLGDAAMRVWAGGFGRGATALLNGTDANDDWHLVQGGFRADRERGSTRFTLQGDGYDARPDPDGGKPVIARGGNVIARWTRTRASGGESRLQVYYDRTFRDFRNGFTEDLGTYDADWQHGFQLAQRHQIIWGLGVRVMNHNTQNLAQFRFEPARRVLHLYSGFVQDEINLRADRLRLALGTKLERNDYTGWEVQPSARLAWTPNERQTLWTAVSRAVRTPVRFDRDFYLDLASGMPFIVGGGFESEELLAYEAGWRTQPSVRLSFALSAFYNVYDGVRSVEPAPGGGLPVTFGNGVQGYSTGAELSSTLGLCERWRLRGGYTYFDKHLKLRPGSGDLNQASAESDDARHQVVLQSIADLPGRFELDVVARYVSALPKPAVPSYLGLDVRLGWQPSPSLDLAIVGQNLIEQRHPEFRPSSPSSRRIRRGVYGRITWRP